MRLDAFLAHRLAIGRTQIKRLLERGAARLDGRRVGWKDKGLFLCPGQLISIKSFHPPRETPVLPQLELPLTILDHGDGWVAVDKPTGMPVHPLRPDEEDTVLNALIARYPQIQGIGEAGLRSGVVHRLDVDTSGVLLFATTHPMWQTLRRAFAQHATRKIYRAIVRGELHDQANEVMDLVVSRHRPAKVRVVSLEDHPKPPSTRRCDLTWRAIENFDSRATLIEVNLGTGFLHQIRAMMSALGHPLLGDALYGEPSSDPLPVPRQMLHASHLQAGSIPVDSPDPADFARALAHLRASSNVT